MRYKFNITLSELENAVEFAKVNGRSEFKTVTIENREDNGIGNNVLISKDWDSEQTDITNYGSW